MGLKKKQKDTETFAHTTEIYLILSLISSALRAKTINFLARLSPPSSDIDTCLAIFVSLIKFLVYFLSWILNPFFFLILEIQYVSHTCRQAWRSPFDFWFDFLYSWMFVFLAVLFALFLLILIQGFPNFIKIGQITCAP